MNFNLSFPDSPCGWFQWGTDLIIGICVAAVLIAVVINFSFDNKEREAQQEKKSFVATGSMMLFLLIFLFVLKYHIGYLNLQEFWTRIIFTIIGLILIVLGTIVNLKGRLILGKNWANQIIIYQHHDLLTEGVYRIVRHPLYASTIWMFYGATLVYFNWVALAGTTMVFLPMMIYRARQEEELLIKRFPNYKQYQGKTGMFFPRILKRGESR
jgi:protein-S-isoprenylcysteine O-methyltransferase Ste14